jgi:hypothetical protein
MKIGYQRTDCSIRPKVTTIDTPPHKTNKGKEKDEKRKENEKAKTSYIFFLTDVRSLSCLILCAECWRKFSMNVSKTKTFRIRWNLSHPWMDSPHCWTW